MMDLGVSKSDKPQFIVTKKAVGNSKFNNEKATSAPGIVGLQAFLNEVSIVGMKQAVNRDSSLVRRLIWSVLVIAGLIFATYQISTQTLRYLEYSTFIITTIEEKNPMEFPTITICREGLYNQTALLEIDPSGNLSWAYSTLFGPLLLPVKPEDVAKAHDILTDLNDIDWEYAHEHVATNTQKMMLYCSLNGLPCEDWFTVVSTQGEGQCLQLNPAGNATIVQTGLWNGIRLVLDADQENVIASFTAGMGFKIHMHDHDEPASVSDLGFTVGVNKESVIKIASAEIKRLPAPYGDCRDEKSYRFTKCTKLCNDKFTFEICGCRYTAHWIDDYNKEAPICTGFDGITCIRSSYIQYVSENVLESQCDCPPQCHQRRYPISMTGTEFSDYFIRWMQTVKLSELNSTEEYMRKNLAYVIIYFESLQHERQEAVAAYTLLSLLCDVGGALGLILGSTILTAFEIGDFLCVSAFIFKKRRTPDNKVIDLTK